MDFGAFVNFFGKRDGLVHISQMTWERGANPKDPVALNDDDLIAQQFTACHVDELPCPDVSERFVRLRACYSQHGKNHKNSNQALQHRISSRVKHSNGLTDEFRLKTEE